MSIPTKYCPPPISEQSVAELCKLVTEIEDSPQNSVQATDLIAKFNTETRKNYSEFDFRTYYEAVDLDTFVRDALIPQPQRFLDISDEELIEIIEAIRGGLFSEWEESYWLNFLEVNLDCNEIINLIYWSEDDLNSRAIIKRARATQCRVLIVPST